MGRHADPTSTDPRISTVTLTVPEKKAILDKCLIAIGCGFEAMQYIYKDHGVCFPTINKWVAEIPEYADKLADAKSMRAINYVIEAKNIMDNSDCMFSTGSTTKDSMALYKKAEWQANLRLKWAGALDPSMWGEMAKEVRELQKEIKKLQEVVRSNNTDIFSRIKQITQ